MHKVTCTWKKFPLQTTMINCTLPSKCNFQNSARFVKTSMASCSTRPNKSGHLAVCCCTSFIVKKQRALNFEDWSRICWVYVKTYWWRWRYQWIWKGDGLHTRRIRCYWLDWHLALKQLIISRYNFITWATTWIWLIYNWRVEPGIAQSGSSQIFLCGYTMWMALAY